jgi:hypothetical protein
MDLATRGQHKLVSLQVVTRRLAQEGWEDVPKEHAMALLLVLKDGLTEPRDLACDIGNDKLLERTVVVCPGYVQPALVGEKRPYEEVLALPESQEGAWKLAGHRDRDLEEWRLTHPLSFSRRRLLQSS